jgi:hypothetical protein
MTFYHKISRTHRFHNALKPTDRCHDELRIRVYVLRTEYPYQHSVVLVRVDLLMQEQSHMVELPKGAVQN